MIGHHAKFSRSDKNGWNVEITGIKNFWSVGAGAQTIGVGVSLTPRNLQLG